MAYRLSLIFQFHRTVNRQRKYRQLLTAGLKPLPVLDYSINVLASNEHFTNRANPFPNFGNGSSLQNVTGKAKNKTNIWTSHR
jgi:hypothetical protein